MIVWGPVAPVAPEAIKVVCAWCGQTMAEGRGPVSHGICPPCGARWEADEYRPVLVTRSARMAADPRR